MGPSFEHGQSCQAELPGKRLSDRKNLIGKYIVKPLDPPRRPRNL